MPSSRLWEYFDWMRQRRLSPETIRSRRRFLTRAEIALETPLHRAGDAQLRGWWNTFTMGKAPATIHRYRSDLRSFYAWCVDLGLRRDDPSRHLPAVHRPHYLPRPTPAADLVIALATAPPRTRVIMALMVYAGMRAVEVARLDRADILDADRLLLVHGKGDRERVVPISPTLWDELRTFGIPQRGPVVIRERGDLGPRLTPGRVGKIVGDHLRSLGITHTPHSLRHYFAGAFLKASGGDIEALAEAMGHASLTTSRVYARWSPDHLQEIMNRMPGVDQHAPNTRGGSHA